MHHLQQLMNNYVRAKSHLALAKENLETELEPFEKILASVMERIEEIKQAKAKHIEALETEAQCARSELLDAASFAYSKGEFPVGKRRLSLANNAYVQISHTTKYTIVNPPDAAKFLHDRGLLDGIESIKMARATIAAIYLTHKAFPGCEREATEIVSISLPKGGQNAT